MRNFLNDLRVGGFQATQHIKRITLSTAGLLVALFVGLKIGAADYEPLLFGLLFVVGVSLLVFTSRTFWVLTIASSFLGGTFPILGGSFTPFQILMAIGVAKF